MAADIGALAKASVDVSVPLAAFDRAMGVIDRRVRGLVARPFSLNITPGSLALGLGLGAIGTAVDRIASASSNLVEATNKASVTFGKSSGVVLGFADQMAAKFGAVKSATLDATANLGAFAQGMGMAEDASAAFATKFVKLAMDLKSFNNLPDIETALVKIQAALAGETEPLARLGVDVHEATVKQFALARGIAQVGVEMTQRQKTMARAALIEDRLSKVTGDMDRTIGDFANASTRAEGNLENLAAAVGEALMPAFTAFRTLQNEVLGDLIHKTEDGKSRIGEFADTVKAKVEGLASVYRNWGLYVERTQLVVGQFFLNMAERIVWLGQNVGAFGKFYVDVMVDSVTRSLQVLSNFKDNAVSLMKELFDYIKSGFKDPIQPKFKPILDNVKFEVPELKLGEFKGTDVSDRIKELDGLIAANDAAVKAANVPGAKPEIKPMSNIEETVKGKKAGGFTNLEEYYKNLQGGAFGKKDPVQQGILANGQRAANGIDRLNNMIGKAMKPGVAVAAGPA